NNLVVFPDNHDMSRIFTQVDHDVRKWNMAMTLFLTTRGIPQVFYGTEILMSNPDTDDHGIIRTDFPGGWAQDNQKNGFNDVGLSEDEKWAKHRVRTLLNLRRNHASFFDGELKHYAPKEGVYTYFRVPASPSDGLLMTVLSKKEQSVALSEYAEMLSGFKTLTKVSTGEVFSTDDKVSIEAMSAQVFIVR
ncbi:MAG: cyclomaltodextrinase C-terminal domain-containing protein, partial [Pseudomonadota bacterium]|nr:cyclomaltodextrinase C-terminal domain-containing protein [Pseudomonadota bacterium]